MDSGGTVRAVWQSRQSAERPDKYKSSVFELRRVSVESGELQSLHLAMEDPRYLSLHRDGRGLAFTAGQGWAQEVWVMENFLPELTGVVPQRRRRDAARCSFCRTRLVTASAGRDPALRRYFSPSFFFAGQSSYA